MLSRSLSVDLQAQSVKGVHVYFIFLVLQALCLWTTTATTNDLVRGCTCEPVLEGNAGAVSFKLSRMLVSSSANLLLRVTKEDGPDLLLCRRNEEFPETNCSERDPRFSSDGIVDDQLTLVIINSTRDLQGLYVLRIAFNNTGHYDPVVCNFTLLQTKGDEKEQYGIGGEKTTIIAAVVPCILSLIIIACVVFFFLRIRSKRTRDQAQRRKKKAPDPGVMEQSSKHQDETEMRPLCTPKPQRDQSSSPVNRGTTRSYGRLRSRTLQKSIPISAEEGSYYIRANNMNKNAFFLAVRFQGKIKYFDIYKTDSGRFWMPETNTSFETLKELEEYYRHHTITCTDPKFPVKPDYLGA